MHESVCVYDITLCVYKNVQNCTQTKLYIHKYVRTHSLNLPMQKCKKKSPFKIRLTVVSNFQRVFLVMHESVCVYDITLCVYKNVQNCTQTKLYIHKYVRTHSLNLPMQKCKKKSLSKFD